MSKRLTTAEFIDKSSLKHKGIYSYKSTVYVNQLEKVVIECVKHGEFEQIPANHMQGQGCPKCGLKIQKTSQLSNKTAFLDKAYKKHGDRYNYESAVYLGSKIKLCITCGIHGDFEQSPNMHLRGNGCPMCHLASGIGYSRSDFIKIARGRKCTFYTIKLFNDSEEFYKIGITSRSIKERYLGFSKMPYKYEIVHEVKGEAGEIWNLELKNKKILKDYKYKPLLKFKGSSTECFNKKP